MFSANNYVSLKCLFSRKQKSKKQKKQRKVSRTTDRNRIVFQLETFQKRFFVKQLSDPVQKDFTFLIKVYNRA